MPDVGPMGVFGVDMEIRGLCVLAFFPFLGFFLFAHWLSRSSPFFRGTVYSATALFILAIVMGNLLKSPPYPDNEPPTFSSWLKGEIAPPGVAIREAGDDKDWPPENTVVIAGLGVGLFLLGLSMWDAWGILSQSSRGNVQATLR
jgi:hypothetical protein